MKLGAAAAAYSASPTKAGFLKPQEPARRGPAKKVVIIGAGLAGLSGGYELTQAGHEVTVLEATMRPGGRALTIREPFSDGLYADAGAALL